MTPIPVTQVKNWLWCPRQVFYSLVLGLPTNPTGKMREGALVHQEVEHDEARRGLARFGLEERTREFRPWLFDPALGLSGQPDLALKTGEVAALVDFKLTGRDPGPSEWFQLAAYGFLWESVRQTAVDRLVVCRIPDNEVFVREFSAAWRERVRCLLGEILQFLHARRDPGPSPEPARCLHCEWVNFCGDVW